MAEKGPWERGQNIYQAAKQSCFHRHLKMQIISIIILLRTCEARNTFQLSPYQVTLANDEPINYF